MTQRNTEAILQTYTKLVDPVIKKLLAKGVSKQTRELLHYQINTGGKRLRPALAIVSCLACGGKLQDVMYPAAGLEILHTYTLIIDDIIDNSIKRRNKPTAWTKFGKSIAECIAMDYAAAILQAAQHAHYSKTISLLFVKVLKTVIEGQILDILFEKSGREGEPYIKRYRPSLVGEDDYIKMISKKTAFLIQACCQMGGICARASKKELHALKMYGYNLGIVYQISDDMLDIFGQEQKFGKKIGKDIEERKRGNILIMYALQSLGGKEKEQFENTLGKPIMGAGDLKKGVHFIIKTDAIQKANVLLQKSVTKAKRALNSLPQNKWRQLLFELTDFIAKREK